MTELYHTDINMPDHLKSPIFQGVLKYSQHAKSESTGDKYGNITLPLKFEAKNAKLIEVEFDENSKKVLKQVWRQQLDETRDLILVIGENGFVRTVWCNLRSDTHRSLNPSKYVR
ncbi:MAG: hypothetical protein Q7S87_08955 [Agitococcus sp.]|nr:hypothetical protein [Agitococcus sp.]MDO9177029.1 hypothetical protein [Agitococcus sp.]